MFEEFKKFKCLSDFQEVFPTEQSCIDYLKQHLWGDKTPTSPFDPTSKIYERKDNRYRCKNTGKYFNIRNGTIFENSKLKLKRWFLATYVFISDKGGTSSYHLARCIGVTQKTAWFMLQRMRESPKDNPFTKGKLKGSVEMDEKFTGGKNKNRHWNKKVPYSQGRSCKDKIPIFGMIERGSGRLLAWVVPNTKAKTLVPIIREHVEEGSNVYTDEWLAYRNLGKWYNHGIINHKRKEYVNGEVHTNTIEGAWSQLSDIINTYRHISRKHAQRYINEFTFRHNTRKYSDRERFDLMLSLVAGKRITYQQLIS